MARRKDSPQKAAMREMMRDYLKNNDISIKDGTDVNSIMRDMMSVLLEGALDEELDEELGYSKYDYRNKETDNSRNGHSSKTMHARPSWRETATTTLHMGHFIETMPFDPRNKSNNRLFLQQGQAT